VEAPAAAAARHVGGQRAKHGHGTTSDAARSRNEAARGVASRLRAARSSRATVKA
jgi:hypothetical protein